MLVKIVLVAAVVIAGLAYAERADLAHKWGIAGSCESVRAPVHDGNHWYACKEGLLTGYPSLIGDQCRYESRVPGYEYWSCPARIPRFGARS